MRLQNHASCKNPVLLSGYPNKARFVYNLTNYNGAKGVKQKVYMYVTHFIIH